GRRHEAAPVLRRLSAGPRQGQAEGNRVRHRRDPARRLREDSGDAPSSSVGPGRAAGTGSQRGPEPLSEDGASQARTRGRGSRGGSRVTARAGGGSGGSEA